MILKFTLKILQKEWKKLTLPFLSVLLTATVITTSFFLIDSARNYILSKNLEILGGDMVFESSKSFTLDSFLDKEKINKISSQISFSGLVSSFNDGEIKNSGANFKIVDKNYPLYGELKLEKGSYIYPDYSDIYVDQSLAESLSVELGRQIFFNNATFTIVGIVKEDPESLIPSFNISGKVYLAKEAIEYSKVDLNFFRKEYEEKIILTSPLSQSELKSLKEYLKQSSIRVKSDSGGQNGFLFGLEVVEKFLIVTILIISILSLVNIYASVNYLATRLRRSFAILISIGMNMENIYKILFLINFIIILIGNLVGIVGGYYLAQTITQYVNTSFNVSLNVIFNLLEIFLIFISILVTSIFATFPVLNRLRNISPKELLSHGEKIKSNRTLKSIFFDIMVGVLPITFLAMYFLQSFLYGGLSILGIIVVYGGLMIFYYYFIDLVYRNRNIFNFPLKMITTQKKFDGFFGLITFASLFVALAAIYNLSIVRTSVDDFLKKDLSRSLPSTYILDVQGSQEVKLKENFPEITLFSNVRARIIKIDEKDIQKALEEKTENIDRELSREFNLTYRSELLPSEKIVEIKNGTTFESMGLEEVSLEKDFAKKAGIKLGSEIVFLIQGVNVKAKVTSIREVDTRSGYPFFYFIFSPDALRDFPKTMFGYANYTDEKQGELKDFLVKELPNISVIDTGSITKIAENLIGVLLLIILIITLPPLFLSSMLIVTILASVAKERKRDGARLMALGKTNNFVLSYYIFESISTTVLASVFAYLFALLLSNFVIMQYLKIDNLVIFDPVSFYVFLFILCGIFFVSVLLWLSGNKSLKEYLNYEENN